MATVKSPEKRTPRGSVYFELRDDGRTVAVHVDRQGFRRLLGTLERLAETGERQIFGKSGRGQSGKDDAVAKLVFHIDSDR